MRPLLAQPNTSVHILRLALSDPRGHFRLTATQLDSLFALLRQGTSVADLDVSGSPLQEQGARRVAELLRHPGCPLEKLNVSECLIGTGDNAPPPPPPPRLLISQTPHSTWCVVVCPERVRSVSCPPLSSWSDFFFCVACAGGCIHVLEASYHAPRLKSLNLAGNDVGTPGALLGTTTAAACCCCCC